MKHLKINMWTAIFDFVNAILFGLSWPIIFSSAISDSFGSTYTLDGVAFIFFFMAAAGLIIILIAMIKSSQAHISIVGPVLGMIGYAIFFFGALFALPALIFMIIATVFSFMQKPVQN